MSLLKNQLGLQPWLPLIPSQLGCAEARFVYANDQKVLTQHLDQQPRDPHTLVVESRLVEMQLGRVEGAEAEAEAVMHDLDDAGPFWNLGQVQAVQPAYDLRHRQLWQADLVDYDPQSID